MSAPDSPVAAAYIAAARHSFNHSLTKITHCLSQLQDSHMSWRPFDQQNSLANIILHLCGNIRQWILSGVGGAPDIRDRLAEFSDRAVYTKQELLERLTQTVHDADRVIAALTPAQLTEPRRIQEIDANVLAAIFDVASHLVGHTHQIVYITRWLLRDQYKFHWTPKTPADKNQH